MKILTRLSFAFPMLRTSLVSPATFGVAACWVWGAFSGFLAADMLPGSLPKEWPADQTKHQIIIRRVAADDQQSAMIAAAEAAPPSKETLRKAAEAPGHNDPLGLAAAAEVVKDAGDHAWWYKEQFGIRIPGGITADAVAYYTDLVEKFGRQDFRRYTQPSSRLVYHASVKFHATFQVDEKSFKDVHVATLKLSFSQNFVATQTEGLEFDKERIVVLDATGKVLHISGDGPTEVMVLAI